MKTCSKCKLVKELICFSKDKSRFDGFSYQCKECCAERYRKYRQANAEKIAERHCKWKQENPEKFAEFQRKYQQANAEKIAEFQLKYRQKCKQEQSANLFFQMAHFASEITKTTITP
jgi:hypothetical protein